MCRDPVTRIRFAVLPVHCPARVLWSGRQRRFRGCPSNTDANDTDEGSLSFDIHSQPSTHRATQGPRKSAHPACWLNGTATRSAQCNRKQNRPSFTESQSIEIRLQYNTRVVTTLPTEGCNNFKNGATSPRLSFVGRFAEKEICFVESIASTIPGRSPFRFAGFISTCYYGCTHEVAFRGKQPSFV